MWAVLFLFLIPCLPLISPFLPFLCFLHSLLYSRTFPHPSFPSFVQSFLRYFPFPSLLFSFPLHSLPPSFLFSILPSFPLPYPSLPHPIFLVNRDHAYILLFRVHLPSLPSFRSVSLGEGGEGRVCGCDCVSRFFHSFPPLSLPFSPLPPVVFFLLFVAVLLVLTSS